MRLGYEFDDGAEAILENDGESCCWTFSTWEYGHRTMTVRLPRERALEWIKCLRKYRKTFWLVAASPVASWVFGNGYTGTVSPVSWPRPELPEDIV